VRRRTALTLFFVGAPASLRAEGYRLGDYRAPVPETVPGGRRISTAEARRLHEAGGAYTQAAEAVLRDAQPLAQPS